MPTRAVCYFALLLTLLFTRGLSAKEAPPSYPAPAEVRQSFLKLLDRPRIPLDPQPAGESQQRDGLMTERLTIATERKADGR